MRGGDQLALGSGGGSEMADFFTGGWSLDPSRSADSAGQARRQAVEHALAKLGPSDDLWVAGNAFKTTISVEDAGNILSCTAARCHLLRGEVDPLTPAHLALWTTVALASEVVIDEQLVVLSYYPMMSWWGATTDVSCAEPGSSTLRQISMHIFGQGRSGFRGWWRAVSVDWSAQGVAPALRMYTFAPGVTLQVIDRSAVHTAAAKGQQA